MHLRLFAAILLALVSAGCQDENKAANLPRPVDDWHPDQPVTAQTVYVAPDREGETFTVAQEAADRPSVYTVDAMVGQINGRPLYASTVFEDIGEDTLRTMATSQPKADFVRDIYTLLQATLGQKITDALLLAEASASLNEQEQRGLLDMLRKYREDLISQAGGTLAMAESAVREDRGISLDEAVEQRRQQILVSKYLQDKLYPRIHVTRYDVERYYEEHPEKYNPEPEVSVQLLVARNPDDADAVEKALAAGKSFSDIGKMRGVRLSEVTHAGTIETFDGVAFDEANQAVRRLNEGEHSPRLDLDIGAVWVKVAKVQTGESKALPDVYLEIEKLLRAQRFDQLNRKYMGELLKKGNYTPMDQMLDALVEVAVNRYAMGR